MSDGFVEAVGKDSGYGFWISWVDSNGYGHFFAHLDKMPTHQKGAKTPKGTVLGYTGNSGKSSGPHLHWEMALDPKDTGRPKSDILSRVNPLNFYDKEAPFGKVSVNVEKGSEKELTFDHPPEGFAKAGAQLLDNAVGIWNKTYGRAIPALKISPPDFSGKIQKFKEKAQRDADDDMMPLLIPGDSTVIKQQVINNVGSSETQVVYTSSSSMLT